jgi:hypothetical protein
VTPRYRGRVNVTVPLRQHAKNLHNGASLDEGCPTLAPDSTCLDPVLASTKPSRPSSLPSAPLYYDPRLGLPCPDPSSHLTRPRSCHGPTFVTLAGTSEPPSSPRALPSWNQGPTSEFSTTLDHYGPGPSNAMGSLGTAWTHGLRNEGERDVWIPSDSTNGAQVYRKTETRLLGASSNLD